MITDNGPRYGQWTLWPNRLRARGERECVFKVTSPDSERYGQWETERVCVCSKDHNRWFFVGSFRKVAKYSRILLFCLFCQKGAPTRAGGGPARARGGAWARKDHISHILYINSLRPSRSSGFKPIGPGANRRAEFLVPSLWAKLLEEIRLRHSSAEQRPGIADVKNGVPGRVRSGLCVTKSYQQSLFGKFLLLLPDTHTPVP